MKGVDDFVQVFDVLVFILFLYLCGDFLGCLGIDEVGGIYLYVVRVGYEEFNDVCVCHNFVYFNDGNVYCFVGLKDLG